MMPNFDSNFEWAKDWNNNPTRCIHLTHNAYECVLNTLETALIANQAAVKQLLTNNKNAERFDQLVENGVKLKLSIQELKRTGDTV